MTSLKKKLDLPELSRYIVESGKTFEELSEEELSKITFRVLI